MSIQAMAWRLRWLVATLFLIATAKEHPRSFVYPAEPRGLSALDRFRHYAMLEQRVQQRDLAARGLHPNVGSVEALTARVNSHSRRLCGGQERTWSLHSAAHDTDGVQHAVLRRADGGLWQYVALAGERLLVADPPLCARRGAAAAAGQRRLSGQQHSIDHAQLDHGLQHPAQFAAGSPVSLLDPQRDSFVKECEEAVRRVLQNRCQKTLQVTVHSAQLYVIDGLDVKMSATVADLMSGSQASHMIECCFEELKNDDYDPNELLPGLPGKMTYKVSMDVDICQAADAASSEPVTQLFSEHAMGELSKYRGFRHVYDNVTRLYASAGGLRGAAGAAGAAAMRSLSSMPSSVDLRKEYPKCFPNGGSGTVQDQGTCGSCWAFAVASAFMSNLCIVSDNDHVLDNSWGRYEISVQHMMTCNPQSLGCDGGYATAGQDAFKKSGIARKRDVPYKCGGGNSLDHFEVKDGRCSAFPWGSDTSQCVKGNQAWHFEGLYSVVGAHDMMQALADGYALYVTMEATSGFMGHVGSGVFVPDPADSVIGGHAMVCLGYGLHYGTQYWWMQNSWGRRWAENGYVKFAKGENYLAIEETAMVFRGFTEGSADKMPPAVGAKQGGASLLGIDLDSVDLDQKFVAAAAVSAVVAGVGFMLYSWRGAPQGQMQYVAPGVQQNFMQ